MSARPGLFVCLEGIDGAGKTSAITVAGEMLRSQGVQVVSFDKQDTSFGSGYVIRHLTALREIIWGHRPDEPYLELGDFHWVHLQAAWYSAVATCRVLPLLQAGQVVLTDTWAQKFLAKLHLRPGVDLERARQAFADLPAPDLVIMLAVDPAVAAARKETFSASEAGNHDGEVVLSAEAFVDYQRRVAAVLAEFADLEGWVVLDVSGLDASEVGQAVADTVARHLARTGEPGSPGARIDARLAGGKR